MTHLKLLFLALILSFGLSTQTANADLVTDEGETIITVSMSLQEALRILPEFNQNRPIVVCASGIGGVVCEFRFESRSSVQILESLCARGELPANVCARLMPGASVAQVDLSCPVLVNFNIEQTAQLCRTTERNEFCYGAEMIDATPAGLISRPGDIAPLTPVVNLNAAPYNLNAAIYGVTVANNHANLHVEIGDTTGLRMILFGELRMRNRVVQQDAIILPDEPVALTVNAAADLFDVPESFGGQTVVGAKAAGDTVIVDALSDDGEWARIMFAYETPIGVYVSAWINVSALDFEPEDLQDLPLMEAGDFTPNQSFYFLPGGGRPDCAPAGSVLFLQAPEGIETFYIANDAPLTLVGSALMTLVENNRRMEITALSGVVILHGDEEAEIEDIVLPPGFRARIDVVPSEGFVRVADNAEWDEPAPLNRTQMQGIRYYEGLPLDLLNQAVDVPECGPNSTGEDCDIVYDYEFDAELVADLCERGILSEELDICETDS